MNWQQKYANQDKWPNVPFVDEEPERGITLSRALIWAAVMIAVNITLVTLEGPLMSHIVYNMAISGAAANRLIDSLDRDKGPTAYIFQCPQCLMHHFHIDRP